MNTSDHQVLIDRELRKEDSPFISPEELTNMLEKVISAMLENDDFVMSR